MTKSTAKLTLPAALARSILFLASGAALLLAQQAGAQTPTVTYRVAVESDDGMDGGIAWQSVYLLKDGRIASFGTGNHAPNQSNAMRIIDPVGTPGSVRSYNMFPWTQDVSPPNLSGGQNRYVSNYDNHASIYIPSDNKAIWVNHGVFDFNTGTWIYGDRPPLTQGYRAFLDDSAVSMEGAFNPSVAWCSQIDKGVWFGNSDGGFGQDYDVLTVVERSAAGAAKPWKLSTADLGSQGVAGISVSRNSAVCIGDTLYVGGPKNGGGGIVFYKINVPNKTRIATLTPWPAPSGDYFPQMVYDSARNHIVLLGMKVLDYDIVANSWTDVTPSGWPGYRSPMGVYHPTLNAIFFRGMPANQDFSKYFDWNKVTFGPAPPRPNAPTNVTAE